MKFKKWWLPPVFMVVSAVFLVIGLVVSVVLGEDNSMTNHIYFFIGMGIWFFIAVPSLSLIYARRVLADDTKRFLLTLYNSVMIVLPIALLMFAGVNKDLLISLLLFLIWTEMWALLGLAGRGEKKADVWYVPAFLGVAVLVINMYLGIFFSGTLLAAILSCVICPIAIAIYARVCLRDCSSKIFFSVYVSLAIFVSIFGQFVYSIIEGKIVPDGPLDIVLLILSAIGTFILYEFAALLGAGVKIKLPKRKKKAKTKDEKTELVEDTEEAKE